MTKIYIRQILLKIGKIFKNLFLFDHNFLIQLKFRTAFFGHPFNFHSFKFKF